jgi:transcription antitermination factor NusG
LFFPFEAPFSLLAHPDATDGTIAWYALRVFSRREGLPERQLAALHFPSFNPQCKVRKRYSDRFVHVDKPIFPGYLFARFALHDKAIVLSCLGVTSIVSAASRPIAIPDAEIENLRAAIAASPAAQPVAFAPGQRVKVRCGDAIIEGVIKGLGSKRLIVGIELLGRGVELPITEDVLEAAA